MYDCHYDLLTYIYMNRNNLEEVKQHCNKIFNNNIAGGIFNLFYMSEKEMYEELGIKPEEINIIQNIKEVKRLIEKEKIIPKNINYTIGIEGLDYLEKLEDIDALYELGVRSVNPVWNNHNKFGTGVRPIKKANKHKGLTNLGKQLIKKLIETGIAIDLSHSDEETFWDIIEECEKHRKLKPKILASHSNCKAIYSVPRNLTDEQIKAIAEFNGIIGIVEIKSFCSNYAWEQAYIEHIKHVKNILGNVENIVLATDDMSYYKIETEHYQNMNIYRQEEIKERIIKLLQNSEFSEKEIKQIMQENYRAFSTNFLTFIPRKHVNIF